jgi:hypothetical protein
MAAKEFFRPAFNTAAMSTLGVATTGIQSMMAAPSTAASTCGEAIAMAAAWCQYVGKKTPKMQILTCIQRVHLQPHHAAMFQPISTKVCGVARSRLAQDVVQRVPAAAPGLVQGVPAATVADLVQGVLAATVAINAALRALRLFQATVKFQECTDATNHQGTHRRKAQIAIGVGKDAHGVQVAKAASCSVLGAQVAMAVMFPQSPKQERCVNSAQC